MLRILLAILSIVTIVFIPTNTTALTTNTYQIEVIVFSHLTSTGVSQENWPQTYITPFNLENSTTLFQDTDNQNPIATYTLLPNKLLGLTTESNKLAQHPDYKTLIHVAWRQQIPKNTNKDSTIHLYGGIGYNAQGTAKTFDSAQTQPFNSVNTWQVNAILQLSLNRYINTKFNAVFAIPTKQLKHLNTGTNNQDLGNKSISFITLKQSRRMKSYELNYIDNPLYGILIKITPVPSKNPTISAS
jgi:hypothetical protein